MHVLYLTYDGLTSLLGQSQVWPYLKGLAAAGHSFEVISFEQRQRLERIGDTVANQVAEAGVAWHRCRFRTRPPLLAKLIDLAEMSARAGRVAAGGKLDAVHARSYVAAEAALRVKRRRGVPFIFDMRGFWPDERRDGGRWPSTNPIYRRLYRQWKAREQAFIAAADHIVVLTEAAKAIVEGWDAWRGQPVTVIPCCVDHGAFPLRTVAARAAARARLGIGEDATVLVYLGSVGTVYLLGDMLRFYARMRRATGDARFLLVGWHDHASIMATARAEGLDIPGSELIVQPAEHGEVPFWLGAADLGIALRTTGFSSLGASPTKLAEYLACGLPVVANDGVGDVRAIVERLGAGAVLADASEAEMDRVVAGLDGILRIDPAGLRERSRAMHDLDVALARYRAVYDTIAARRSDRTAVSGSGLSAAAPPG